MVHWTKTKYNMSVNKLVSGHCECFARLTRKYQKTCTFIWLGKLILFNYANLAHAIEIPTVSFHWDSREIILSNIVMYITNFIHTLIEHLHITNIYDVHLQIKRCVRLHRKWKYFWENQSFASVLLNLLLYRAQGNIINRNLAS